MLKNIEKQFLNVIQNLPVGQLSEGVVTGDGVHGLMLCSPVVNNTFQQLKKSIENNLRNKKIDSASQSLLNRIKTKSSYRNKYFIVLIKQNKKIKDLLYEYHIKPKRKLGQNFIFDENILK